MYHYLLVADDIATATVVPTNGLQTTEAGGTAVFSIVLDSQPSASATIGISSSDTGEGTLSSSSITFATGDWNLWQTVTVTGVDGDALVDGDIGYTIFMGDFTSSDSNFHGVVVDDMSATNIDGGTAFPFVPIVLIVCQL